MQAIPTSLRPVLLILSLLVLNEPSFAQASCEEGCVDDSVFPSSVSGHEPGVCSWAITVYEERTDGACHWELISLPTASWVSCSEEEPCKPGVRLMAHVVYTQTLSGLDNDQIFIADGTACGTELRTSRSDLGDPIQLLYVKPSLNCGGAPCTIDVDYTLQVVKVYYLPDPLPPFIRSVDQVLFEDEFEINATLECDPCVGVESND